MNLQRRVTLFVVAMVTVLSALLGVLLIQQNYSQSVGQVTSEIRNILTAVEATPQDKVTTALSYGRDAQVPISIYISDNSNVPLPILQRDEGMTDEALNNLYQQALDGKVLKVGTFLIGTVAIEGESHILALSSIKHSTDLRNKAFVTLALLIFLICIAMFAALRLVVARDIRRERILIESSERLKSEVERRALLIDFAGDASHELRTPLTVIKGYLELGKNSPTTLNNPETINRLLQESQRMERTISQLLEVFEIESLPQTQLTSINLSTFLGTKVEILRETNPGRNLIVSIEPNLQVKASDELFEKIFGNILSNIYRHTPDNAAVRVIAQQNRQSVSVIIEDGGPGIEKLESARLFSRFDKSRSRESGGSGLGLSILDAAVKRIGGEVTLEKSELGGLKVSIEIPTTND